jgi:hypothetical protein
MAPFLFAAIHGAYPSGHRRCAPMLKIAPGNFLFAAIHSAHPSDHRRCAPMLKIAPGNFLFHRYSQQFHTKFNDLPL